MIENISGTSSQISVITKNKNYVIKGELLVNSFLAYFDTLKYQNSKDSVPPIEKDQLKKEILDYCEKKDFKVVLEESKFTAEKSKAWDALEKTKAETKMIRFPNELNVGSKDIYNQLNGYRRIYLMSQRIEI
ncbi:hypothetical protein GCM10009117_25750 [Gangjinia marincola]|uniref:Uncharacterized protein n=1 Tax=Gangjinia marincola TaxID=578463 RepID=A0ABN1MJM7_9FLAO